LRLAGIVGISIDQSDGVSAQRKQFRDGFQRRSAALKGSFDKPIKSWKHGSAPLVSFVRAEHAQGDQALGQGQLWGWMLTMSASYHFQA